jgi:uncharacterized membrane protein YjgN (DUF898 family)
MVIVAGLVIAPWAIVRSAGFNARYSAYRNLTFGFKSDYWVAVRVLYWWGLIPAVAIGTAFRWWDKPQLGGIAYGIFGLLFPWWLARLRMFIVSNTCFGGIDGDLTVTGGQYWNIYFRGGLIMGLGGLLAAALAAAMATFKATVAVVGLPIFMIVYFGYVFGYAYTQSATANLVWNGTRLGPLRFQSNLRAWNLGWLYCTNTLAIMASLGLLIPWAVMRTLKYRASRLQVHSGESLNVFEGTQDGSVQAAGSEVSQLFDLDLSL